jgi:hypothetical protein
VQSDSQAFFQDIKASLILDDLPSHSLPQFSQSPSQSLVEVNNWSLQHCPAYENSAQSTKAKRPSKVYQSIISGTSLLGKCHESRHSTIPFAMVTHGAIKSLVQYFLLAKWTPLPNTTRVSIHVRHGETFVTNNNGNKE